MDVEREDDDSQPGLMPASSMAQNWSMTKKPAWPDAASLFNPITKPITSAFQPAQIINSSKPPEPELKTSKSGKPNGIVIIPKRDAAFQIESYCTDEKSNKNNGPKEEEEHGHDNGDDNDDDENAADEEECENEEHADDTEPLDPLDPLGSVDPAKEARRPNSEVEELELWFPVDLPVAEIMQRRRHIKERIILELKGNPFELTGSNLRKLVCEYDRLFFENRLFEAMNFQKTAFKVAVGGIRMSKGTAGCCDYQNDTCTIHLHPGLAQLKFGKGRGGGGGVQTCGDVGGIACGDLLECVQLVLEHEFVHMLLMVCSRMMREVHSKRFKDLARGLFGHRLFTHNIGGIHSQGTPEERIEIERDAEEKRKVFKPGTVVRFRSSPVAVIVRKKSAVTVMHTDGHIVENVPYHKTELWTRYEERDDEEDDGPDKQKDEQEMIQQLEHNYVLFLNNKQNLQPGDTVTYSDPDGKPRLAVAVNKKSLGATIHTHNTTNLLLPFHTLRIHKKKS